MCGGLDSTVAVSRHMGTIVGGSCCTHKDHFLGHEILSPFLYVRSSVATSFIRCRSQSLRSGLHCVGVELEMDNLPCMASQLARNISDYQ